MANDQDLAPFAGFDPRGAAFYRGLAEDNSRAYVHAHRDDYELGVREPMERLLAEIADRFGDGRVFRPNRDVRFSKDKRPYKDHCGAVVEPETGEVYYCQFAADHLLAASGYYRMGRDQVERFYAAVDDEETGAEAVRLVDRARADGLDVGGSALKTAPRGYPRDHPRVELLRHKGLTVSRRWPLGDWAFTREAFDRITGVWDQARPLNDWLVRHVGPTRIDEPDRR